ncbi:uncharacterized protein [Antedon mediterranea]|uniref:uncharacterized protein n=1 Tax=Antedon mediterranea TaxID=105859 RepID=UPI003AF4D397
MSDFGRPHRSRKAIDYSSFVQQDGSDDDFEVPTPPLKKIRVDKKATNHKQTKTTKLKNEKKKSTAAEKRSELPEKRERISLEKLEEQSFEREIQKVLELSKQESQKENDEIAAVVHNNNDESNLQPSKANVSPVVAAPHSLLTSIQPPQLNQNCVATHEPSIEILEEDVREGGKPSRRASAPRKSLAENQDDDSDDDFHVGDVDNGSDGDFSDDGDESDYEVSKPKKMTKEPKKKTVANKEKNTTKKSKPTTGKADKKTKASPPSKMTSVSRVPTASLPTKSAAMIPTKTIGRGFTPPANRSGVSKTATYCTPKEIVRKPIVMSPGGENPLGGVKLISLSQPRRLGLSRFARVKSLHS